MEKPLNNLPYLLWWWNLFTDFRYEKQFGNLSELEEYRQKLKDMSKYQVWYLLNKIED